MIRVHWVCPITIALTILIAGDLFGQKRIQPSGTVRTVVTMERGVDAADGFTSIGSLRRFHVLPGDYIGRTLLVKTDHYHDIEKNGLAALPEDLARILQQHGAIATRLPFPYFGPTRLTSVDRYGLGRVIEVTFSSDIDVLELCDVLNRSSGVEYAEPVYVRRTSALPDDPRLAEQYALTLVDAAGAWEISQGDTSVTIAIVDAGTDWSHEDLVSQIWINPNEIPNNGIDDDANGKRDDVRGWDFVGSITAQQAVLNAFSEDNDPGVSDTLTRDDGRYHGTHCAGVASAATNNATGMAGMGYRSRLIPIKCGSDQYGGAIYRGYEAVMYAARLGADVISCSWGGGTYSQTERDVIQQAIDMGSLVVAASGNDGLNTDDFMHYPSSYRRVLSVGASSTAERPALFSNYGITTTAFAPGVNILSTVGGDRYSSGWSGTSMSTPLVSGLAALLKAQHPTWTPEQLLHQIRSTVENVLTVDSSQRPLYFGRVAARTALTKNQPGADTGLIPGIAVIDAAIDAPGGIISDTVRKDLRLAIRNYLGAAKNLRVRVTAMTTDVELTNNSTVIDSLGTLSIDTVVVTIRIPGSEFWYQGTADLLVQYDCEGYSDLELIQIPFTFPSTTSYTLRLAGLPGNTVARAAHSPSPGVMWGVGDVPGVGGGFIRFVGAAYTLNFISPTALTSVFAFDANRAFTASGPVIFRTSNGGTQWTNTSISTVTPGIQDIHFFSTTHGIVIGDPLGPRWGIAVTTDGGATWDVVNGVSPPNDSETLRGEAVAWLGGNGWFGTSDGRVYRSSDSGRTWTASTLRDSTQVLHLAFNSMERGVAIYRDLRDAEQPMLIATTTDGGSSWSPDVARIDDLSIDPVHLASPGGRGVYLMMGVDGRVLLSSDHGTTWVPQPTHRGNAVITAGTSSSDSAGIRVWNLGTTVGYLDIPYDLSSAPHVGTPPTAGIQITEIAPNPGADHVTIAFRSAKGKEVSITMVNDIGQVVAHRAANIDAHGEGAVVLDVASLPAGRYICRVAGTHGWESRLLTIMR